MSPTSGDGGSESRSGAKMSGGICAQPRYGPSGADCWTCGKPWNPLPCSEARRFTWNRGSGLWQDLRAQTRRSSHSGEGAVLPRCIRCAQPRSGTRLKRTLSCSHPHDAPPERVLLDKACAALGVSRETLRQLRLRGLLQPGKHDRRWGCTQGRGPLQWHLENVEATITGWSRRHLRL